MGIFNIRNIILLIAFVFVVQFINTDSQEFDGGIMLSTDTKILAFGDSITYGYRVASEENYPTLLQSLIGGTIYNEGISGEASAEGLRRLPSLLDHYKPDILIVCHGGNDILRRHNLAKTKENIGKMIALAQEKNIHVILVGIPTLDILTLSTASFYKELASEYSVELEDKALEQILDDDKLKIDKIHPNAQGYDILAKKIATLITNTYTPHY
ncbi:MAG: arylesterase [Sulfurospirillum sp.]|nr:arylesterase [Sulfurospirillum sp.]